jgi:feruloyl esterase
VPLTYFAGLVAARPLRQIEIAQPGAWISPAKRKLIAKETQRLCDGLDGLKDGVILNYKACDALVRPSKTNAPFRNLRCPDGKDDGDECLSDAQLKTLDMLHSPVELGVPLLNGETFAFAFPAGAEDRGGWAEMPDQDPAGKPAPAIANYHLSLRYAHTPTHGDLYSHTPQEAADIIKDLSAHVDISEDLSKFFARNGKLILYSNGNDYLSNVTGQYYYYEQVQKRLGKAAVKRHFRFYVSPFGPHGGPSTAYGSNTPLPHYTDLMGTLERWVEKGVAPPNALVQTLEDKTPPYTVIRSRIICQYPMHPQYKGSGSADLSTSYVCAG